MDIRKSAFFVGEGGGRCPSKRRLGWGACGPTTLLSPPTHKWYNNTPLKSITNGQNLAYYTCSSCSKKIYRKDKSTAGSRHEIAMLASLWFVTSVPWCPFISHWVRRTRKRERSAALQVRISLRIRIKGTMWTLIRSTLQSHIYSNENLKIIVQFCSKTTY